MPQNYGLGRGLASLIPTDPKKQNTKAKRVEPATDEDAVYKEKRSSSAPKQVRPVIQQELPSQDSEVSLDMIGVNPHQPRKKFNDEKLQELSRSIREHGIVQPLIVTKSGEGYELVAGERRMRAAKMAGLKKVPVVIKDIDDQQKLEMAIIENIQRHDLDTIEEARAYQRLADEFQLNQDEIATKMGKSRSVVANKIRLLQLPVDIQKGIEEGKITEGHAKAILSLENSEKQRALYDLILKQHLTVRQTEARSQQELGMRSNRKLTSQDPQLKAVEDEMHELLGTKVKVSKQGDGAKVVIDCYTKQELDELVNKVR